MECPICNKGCAPFMEVFDDRYGYLGTFTLLECESCNHLFIDKMIAEEDLSDLYSSYYPRSDFELSKFVAHPDKNRFILWLNGDNRSAYRWVPENITVLDIGCGFGESLAYHKSRGCDVYGVEADVNIRRVADKFGYNVHVGLFDPEIYEPAFFDYITMDQVIEHVPDPISTLKGVEKILKPGGRLLLAVPNPHGWGAKLFRKRWIHWHAPYHQHHYSVSSMSAIAEQTGFHIDRIISVTSSSWLYFQWNHLITYPAIGERSDYWGGMKFKDHTAKKQLFLLTVWFLHKLKLNHIITRLFDWLGLGDGHLFFLSKKLKNNV